jgi:hypothetical protein
MIAGAPLAWNSLFKTRRAVDGNVGRRPLVIPVHPAGFRPAAGASHRPAPGPGPHDDRLAGVLDILDEQHRCSREHNPHKLCYVNHG